MADPGNTSLQRDLLVSYERIGCVLREQGNLDEALKFCQNGFTLAERLLNASPENSEAQRDLFASCEGVGNVLKAQGHLEEALTKYQKGLLLAKRLANAEPNNSERQNEHRIAVGAIGGIAYRYILARNFSRALEIADESIAAARDLTWLYANRACCLMFLGRVDEARAVYIRYRGEQKVQGGKSWEAVVLQGFTELRKVGLAEPLMGEMEQLFTLNRKK